MSKEKSTDVLGIAPYGEAVNTLAKGAVKGLGEFLGRICLPAAESLGFLFADQVNHWRAKNAAAIIQNAENKLNKFDQDKKMQAHPRLVMKVLEEGSWNDDDQIQNMWAGLLATSCTIDGRNDENLLFMNILSQLTIGQVAILDHACKNSTITPINTGEWTGLLTSNTLVLSMTELRDISGIDDIHRLDRELDHMRSLELIKDGIAIHLSNATISLTTIALQMYARSQGHYGNPALFFIPDKEQGLS